LDLGEKVAVAGVVVSVVGFVVSPTLEHFFAIRRRHRDRTQDWDEVIRLARLVDADHEPELVRAIAKDALHRMGVTAEYLADLKTRFRHDLTSRVFQTPEPASGDMELVADALSVKTEMDGDIAKVLSAVRTVDGAIRKIDRKFAHDVYQRRMGIMAVMVVMAGQYIVLAGFAIKAAIGN
jgi:hypothetical protein